MVPDYRSPLRPIPIDTIPDLMFSYDSGQQMTHHGGLTHIDIEYQLVDNDGERNLPNDDEHNTASCSKDPWWVEAVKVADDIENKQKTFELSNMVSLLYLPILHLNACIASVKHRKIL